MRVAHDAMTFAQLQALVAVAECGSFTAAAARLSLTQPGVSRAVQALERELGVALLDRDGAGAQPTAAGDEILAHARAVLAGAERLRQVAGAARGTLTGRVRVGAFQSVAARVLPARIAAFRAQHPGVEVSLLEGTDDEVLAWLRRGAARWTWRRSSARTPASPWSPTRSSPSSPRAARSPPAPSSP